MQHFSSPGHAASCEVESPASHAFAYLRDPMNLGHWALGSWQSQSSEDGDIYSGTSLFSAETSYYRITSNPELKIIDYHVGAPDALKPRISVRVIDGEICGRDAGSCVVTLSAWRDASMSEERWRQLCVCHETEILIIKGLIERAK